MRRTGPGGRERSTEAFRIVAWPAKKTGNPHVRLLVDALDAQEDDVIIDEFVLRKGWFDRPDVVHINWPEMASEPASLIAATVKSALMVVHLMIWRVAGVPVVWTVHNLASHEQRHPRLERWVKRALFAACRGSIHLSEAGRREAEAVYPQLTQWPTIVAGLPALSTCNYAPKEPGPVHLISFGRIRPYKNIPHLLETFVSLDPDNSCRLTIAGRADDPAIVEQMQKHQRDPRVDIDTRWFTDNEIKALVATAHAVILPHRALFNSGALIDALALGVPTAITRSAVTEELADSVGSEWVRMLSDQLTIEELEATIEWARQPRVGAAPLPGRHPDAVARVTLDHFVHVAGTS